MHAIPALRPSPIAGAWYEGRADRLARAVDGYLDGAELPELPGEVIAVIAPHAGHVYSGPVAGYAFAAVRGRTFDLAAVISPMHQPRHEPLLTTAHEAYTTPLGAVPVDADVLADLDRRLRERLGHGVTPVAHDREHSLEIELPFLQRALAGGFQLLPVMVGAHSTRLSRELGAALAATLAGRSALLVASTDLSHFYPQEAAARYDAEMLARIEAFDPEGAFRAEAEDRGYACGLGALAAVLWAARALGADAVKILRHATSGDMTGDFSSVVGYGAAAVLRTEAGATSTHR